MVTPTEIEKSIFPEHPNKDVVQEKDKVKDNNCKEYQTLKYKTMIATGNTLEHNIDNESNEDQLHSFLENEMKMNKKQGWSKMTKTEKIKRIKSFIVNDLKQRHNLNENECLLAKRYLLNLIDRKRLTKVNELDYDETNQKILDIHIITFNETTRRFALNKDFNNTSKKQRSTSGTSSTRRKKTTKHMEDN